MRLSSTALLLVGLALSLRFSHAAGTLDEWAAQLDSPAENVRSNAASALLGQGQEGRDILLERAGRCDGATSLEAISALRGDPKLMGDGVLARLMGQWIEKSAPLLSPPFPDPASLVENGGFEHDGGWEFHTEGGAEASFDFTDSRARSGHRSLAVSRKNAAGNVWICSRPVTIPAGVSATARLFFHAQNAPFVSTLRLRFEDEAGIVLAGDEMHGHLRQSQTLVQNSPAGQWIKRVGVLLPEARERKVRLRIFFDGNPGDLWLDDLTFPSRPYSYRHTAPLRPLQSAVPDSLPTERPVQSALVRRDSEAMLLRNGKPCAPVMYHNMQATFGDFAQMGGRAGLNWQVVMLPFRQNPTLRDNYPPGFEYWREDCSFDVEGALKEIATAAARMPQPSSLVLGLGVAWPNAWTEKHLNRRWKAENGDYAVGTEGHVLGFTRELPPGLQWWLSPFDEASIAAATDGVRQLVRAARKEPWFARVAGCFIAGGHDGQFFTAAWPDYSEPAVRAFRAWLKRKYKSQEALRAAWRQPEAAFESAVIPPIAAAAKRAGQLFDPARDQAVIDYLSCLSEQGMRIREALAAAFKEEAGKPVIALTWEMSGGGGPSVASIFLESKSLDGVVPQPFYELRLPGLAGGITAPLASYNLHGKLCIKELDLRTWLRAGGGEVDNQRISAAMTPGMFRDINRKEAGQMIAAHQGFWYYDIGTTHFRDPALLDEIATAREAADRAYPRKNEFRPQMAVVHCGDATLWEVPAAYNPVPLSLLNRFNHSALKASGVPYDAFFLGDFMTLADASHYKVVIFPDAWRLSEAERKWIDANLKKQGRHLVWCYGAGSLTNGGAGEGVEITGIRTLMTRSSQLRAFAGAPGDRRKLTGNTDLILRMYEGLLPIANIPRYVIDDPDAEIIAHYEDGKAAAARRQFPTWTSVYLAMPGGLDPETINRIATDAGALRITKPGLVVEMNSNFLSVHALQAGDFDLQFPAPMRVTELAGKPGEAKPGFTLPAQPGETRWYQLSPP